MPRYTFEITEDQNSQIQRIADRGLTRSQVVQLALKVGLPAADDATKHGIVDSIARQLQAEDLERINKAGAKRAK